MEEACHQYSGGYSVRCVKQSVRTRHIISTVEGVQYGGGYAVWTCYTIRCTSKVFVGGGVGVVTRSRPPLPLRMTFAFIPNRYFKMFSGKPIP